MNKAINKISILCMHFKAGFFFFVFFFKTMCEVYFHHFSATSPLMSVGKLLFPNNIKFQTCLYKCNVDTSSNNLVYCLIYLSYT